MTSARAPRRPWPRWKTGWSRAAPRTGRHRCVRRSGTGRSPRSARRPSGRWARRKRAWLREPGPRPARSCTASTWPVARTWPQSSASLALSLWIAVNLARQLHGLRDSALEMANVRLPDVVRRLRAGENVDVAAQVPRLDAGVDEIGQVKAAFNTAQRTAVEAAVDEASVRRGINDVFRNLARRSQSLLERQMALLDALERRAAEPERPGGPVPDRSSHHPHAPPRREPDRAGG